ncbi:MAG: enolase C-terminal domain-like protein [Brooklawnia sp.]|uniref:enolase C-terminal domain-like protein n=1 Tax=Brooklawnia sp. TaxID=2699740 RepID=UPI003C7799C2
MDTTTITAVRVADRRFDLEGGAGTDSVHTNPQYAYAVCQLESDSGITGVGFVLTLGPGNELVCQAIQALAQSLVGRDLEELMSSYGETFSKLTDSPSYRWLGPHKGVVHLALASVTNACFDLWAKSKDVPLWRLLIDLEPEQVISLLDFRYVTDVMSTDDALKILHQARQSRDERLGIIDAGFPAYDTSVGWFSYPDEQVVENARRAVDSGFTAMKLKVGSPEHERDIRRVNLVRDAVGPDATLMIDVNQQWELREAITVVHQLQDANLYWVEEPTDPDDVLAHQTLARAVYPTRIALGEHVPNKVMFKNFLQVGAMSFNQVDALRVGGVSEFILVSLMSRRFGVPVIPHVGDMGQLHQHLVPFNHISLGHPALFLEHIPHLRKYFRTPARIEGGRYLLPQEPGSSCDFVQ